MAAASGGGGGIISSGSGMAKAASRKYVSEKSSV